MNIGKLAQASGVSAKMVRHYESIGLIANGVRSESGYRIYGERDVHVLRFIRRARDLGFSLEQIRQLLSLWEDKQRVSAEVKALANQHLAELDTRITALMEMRDTLADLAQACCGDNRPDCPILNRLAE
ncbi:Cu(I)-responsive transcriptional regulator [Chitinimonas sp. BJB300]|uniref:Cu(I)-responsive transcriptional regulator n=1 Tax=Chitinimonas sp. BJB300 TaxID=1559339 RepID=UPI000C0D37E2|nr:Cu(I)-responsive transcriptional regulator [Chitinimonas sp. BJB300]PHV10743.1 Cu(I)-responsive transcriptional regulator [Chitinimonas sp. BJB300]TSJ91243.1 Cu(I)-responsive transcriptional regulator [Chitinimonas sp. BJB300]